MSIAAENIELAMKLDAMTKSIEDIMISKETELRRLVAEESKLQTEVEFIRTELSRVNSNVREVIAVCDINEADDEHSKRLDDAYREKRELNVRLELINQQVYKIMREKTGIEMESISAERNIRERQMELVNKHLMK